MAIPKPTRKQDSQALDEIRAQPCMACGKKAPSDPAHIKTRGSGGHDAWWNLLALCRRCHTAQHSLGWVHFSLIYPNIRVVLEAKGWTITQTGLERDFYK